MTRFSSVRVMFLQNDPDDEMKLTMTVVATGQARPGTDAISVFFPCDNEQENIRRVYESTSKVLGRMGVDYKLILVDDGSADQTPQIVDAIAAADPRVRVIHHPTNPGYSSALQSGFRAATRTLVFHTDGDGPFDLNELPLLLPLMKRYDIVSCFRLDRREGLNRKFNAWCWTRLVCLLFRMQIKDINCAFKLFKRQIFDDMELWSTAR
ncbi:MAG: glycosyltransferase family 2 protein [Verrucomicrobiota bacterium]|jgi:glycosyltransferase involved in cell wall biosynthesis